MNVHQRELCAIATAFFSPRAYSQKRTLAKIFVMRWAIASGVDLNEPTDDPDDIRWCKSDREIA